MALAVVSSALRAGWRACGRPGRPACGLRWQSQTQEPPAYPGVVESTAEYEFVERLIPPASIPDPPRHQSYPTPSGWQPPRDPRPNLPYFIRRSRMHNVPVYTELTHGNRQMTLIRKVEGDIWALQKDVEAFLASLLGKAPVTQVNEVTRTLRIKGYFDQQLKAWLLEKGF
ncbi:39S ribosomal protein L49, mitochondrial [Dromiciops gliroides]|uniref:39S ribosomal protein L49, mitochondrial n=1 Tax=Dromiciops gliroides TaxID=33562 RepID=UPI001CC551E9|nr:39S ribosomal protein L49, mitochondrial [Dromiciops gliroides]